MLGVLSMPSFAAFDANKMQTVLQGEHRSQSHKARDFYRHPAETIEFLIFFRVSNLFNQTGAICAMAIFNVVFIYKRFKTRLTSISNMEKTPATIINFNMLCNHK